MADGTDELPAGSFVAWLGEMQRALDGDGEADVPCDGCTACCRSSQFVHIAPEETGTLAHIPRALLFPAPRLPKGHVVLGYDENGCCPMLGENGCSIYEHRPRACRTYDCRVFAAAGVEPEDKPFVAARVKRWRFEYANDEEREAHRSVQRIAAADDDSVNATEAALRALRARHSASPSNAE